LLKTTVSTIQVATNRVELRPPRIPGSCFSKKNLCSVIWWHV